MYQYLSEHHCASAEKVRSCATTALALGAVLFRTGAFWQKRYHDPNVSDAKEFSVKLRYLHRNPVKRGLVVEPYQWKWSSFRHYYYREMEVVEIESEWTVSDRERREQGGPERIFLGPKL